MKMKKWKKHLKKGILTCMMILGISLSGGICAKADVDIDPALTRHNVAGEEEFPKVGDSDSSSRTSKYAWKRVNGVCYNGSGSVVEGAITRGIDVSEWQGKINWAKVKNSDIDFAFIRISSGTNYMDKYYDYNMTQANSVGLPVGTYVYSKATTTKQALAEAQLAIKKMQGYKVSYPVVYDIEYEGMSSLSKTKVAKLALAFCNEIRAAGYTPMIYTNTDWYDNHINMSMLSGIPVWIASYSDTKPAPDKSHYTYGIWQCTAGNSGEGSSMVTTKGLVDGIPSDNNVDMNYGYIDYTQYVTPRTSSISEYTPASSPTVTKLSTKNGWYKENGKQYYYVNNEKVTGWKEIDGKYYYFDSRNGKLCTSKLLTIDNMIYYVDKNGVMVTDKWITKGGKTFYMGSEGRAVKGSKKIDGKYYYFDPKTRVMYKDQLLVRNNEVYYFGSDGVRLFNSWKTIKVTGGTRTYYFNSKGKAQKGWMTLNGKKYFFFKSGKYIGVRATSKKIKTSGGYVYVFDKNGVYQGKKKAS